MPLSSVESQVSQPCTEELTTANDDQPSSKTRKASTLRSLKSLNDDHSKFLQEGGGDLEKAKQYNNAIGTPFFSIPVDQVSCSI